MPTPLMHTPLMHTAPRFFATARSRCRAYLVGALMASAVGLAMLGPSATITTAEETSLDRYVAQEDPSYAWEIVSSESNAEYTTFVIHLASQTWRTEADVDRTLWEHWLTIIRPSELSTKKAFLFIGGGSNGGDPPTGANPIVSKIALATGSVTIELSMIPNQTLIFHNDGQRRSEDDLIAYTWDQFLRTGDDTWPARLPMVKSVVRAMDTVDALMASDEGGNVEMEGYVVAGGSKRGWTTWLTAAVDPRVVAQIPVVIDVLNSQESMRHHYAAYGFWAPAVGDYQRHKIFDRVNTPEYLALCRIVDPYFYRERYTMPKFIVNAAGDQFFLPDSSQFYFDDLPGEKYLRYVANGDHSLAGTDAPQSIAAYYEAILTDTPRPKFDWTLADDTLTVTCEDEPESVLLWQATNPEARDFRVASIGRAYTSTELTATADGTYVGQVDEPAEGWTAFFVELVYDPGLTFPLKFTTQVHVVPDVLPFDPPAGDGAE